MKNPVHLVLLTLLLTAVAAPSCFGRPVTRTGTVSYATELLDKGGSYYGGSGAMLVDLSADFGASGFRLAAHHRNATQSGHSNRQRFTYSLAYGNALFQDGPYETSYQLGWAYHHMYRLDDSDAHETALTLSCPSLLPGRLSPRYAIAYEAPVHGGSGGFYHALGCDLKSETFTAFAELAYRDGLGGIHGWTHATIGISLNDISISEGLRFVPRLVHQFSFKDRVNTEDRTALTMQLKF